MTVTSFDQDAHLKRKLDEMTKELSQARGERDEALDQKAATNEILRIISSSPTDVQPVFDSIVANAVRLCGARMGAVYRFDGELVHLEAHHNYPAKVLEILHRMYPRPPQPAQVTGRAILARAVVQVEDLLADPLFTHELALAGGWRSHLAVPMLRDGVPIGAILIARVDVGPFSAGHVELLKSFSDQAVIAIQNTRLFEEVQARTKELTEALEYQTATSDVLGVISRSPSELQPVLDAIVTTANRLCAADYAIVFIRDSDGMHSLRASTNADPVFTEYVRRNPIPYDRGSVVGRAAIEKRTVHLADCLADPEFTRRAHQQRGKFRSMLGVPLIKSGETVGVVLLARTEVRPFTSRQIELVTTFADQAVVAINNVGLFEAVQARTKELQQSLEQQTATSKVLSAISGSPGKLDPVFDTLLASARELCEAEFGHLLLFDGTVWRAAALHNVPPAYATYWNKAPIVAGPEALLSRIANTGQPYQLPDAREGPAYRARTPLAIATVELAGARTLFGVPLLKEGRVIGAIVLYRKEVRPFNDKQIALLSSFADQAVIAIENTRLFEAEQMRTKELKESLEYQTAISDVLGVISRSPNELQPVLDSIVATAHRLCQAEYTLFVNRQGDGLYHHKASLGADPKFVDWLRSHPVITGDGSMVGIVAAEKQTIHFPDALAEPRFTDLKRQQQSNARTMLGVPLIRGGEVIGVIFLARTMVQPFTDRHIELVTTFAKQAVIAINNTRLFAEVQARTGELSRSVAELKALGETGKVVSSSLDLGKVLPTILEHACEISDTGSGSIYVFDAMNGTFVLEAGRNMSEELIAAVRAHPIRLGETLVGQCGERREAVAIEDLSKASPHPLFELHLRTGVHALLAVPLLHQDEVVGALVVRRKRAGTFSPETVALLQSFASQSAIAIRNARLFKEIEEKGRQLEIASQHKSQFVANMSHELRTPLAAMLGYAELLQENIYGALPDKATPIVERIRSNGRHLLGLINTVLDISKIESGQFKLNLGEYSLSSMVETVRVATGSLAEAKSLGLKTDVAKGLPRGLGDEQRLTQVLLNLVGNAIKFTDAGEVRIGASVADGRFTVAVSDTGPGIPPEERDKVFEKFHQIDNSSTRTKGGTGLGLAIAKDIVEMHGGRIWVESTLGKGATFRMELPVRADPSEAGAA